MAFLSSSARRCTAILVTVLVRRSAKDMTGWVCAHGLCTSTCRDTVGTSMCLQVRGAFFVKNEACFSNGNRHACNAHGKAWIPYRATVRAHTVHYPGKVRTPPMVQRAPPTEATSLSQFRSSTHLSRDGGWGENPSFYHDFYCQVHVPLTPQPPSPPAGGSQGLPTPLSLPSLLRRLQEALKVS